MLCRIAASFRASATHALPAPDRLAIDRAQSFRPKARLTRVINTTAASYISVRASAAPHFDILPLRSISPDWYCFGVSPRCAPTDRDRPKRAGSSIVLT